MKFLFCLLVILVVGTLSQAHQNFLRKADAQQILDVIRTYPELFDEVFGAKDLVDNEYLVISTPGSVRRESQFGLRVPKH